MSGSPADPLAFAGWDEALSSHPSATIFHTSAWARVLTESYGFKPLYLSERAPGGDLRGLLPVMEVRSRLTGNRGVCLPFTDSASPIADDEAHYAGMLSEALVVARARGWKYLEIRGGAEYRKDSPSSIEYVEHVLDLDRSEPELFMNLRTNMKRNVQKAQREGVTIGFSDSLEAVESYYRLHCVTRKSHGLPPQPVSFFRNIQANLLSRNLGFVALARVGNDVVAGAVYLHFGKRMVYKYGASSEEGRKLRANNLVMWEAILWGQRNGFDELSFGRTDAGQAGLLEYKRGFGTTERSIRYYRFDPRTGDLLPAPSLGANRLSALFRRMPIPVS
ncbi:MAG TPA: GNAT family N-acetyltransferase, partial [Candidatus Deferrimicrobiaceae bacterium]